MDTVGATSSGASAEETSPFARRGVFSKPVELKLLIEDQVESRIEIVRPRVLTESVQNGRGNATIRGYVFRKFGDRPRLVLFLSSPGSTAGSFEPSDKSLTSGELVQLSFSAGVPGLAQSVFFSGKGYFLRKSFYIAENPEQPSKPWVGQRDAAEERFERHTFVNGQNIIEVRLDSVTSFPDGPGRVEQAVLERYLSQARLLVIPNGAPWGQKSNKGIFFEDMRDGLDKFLTRPDIKAIEGVELHEFANLGEIQLTTPSSPLAAVEREGASPKLLRAPNDHLQEINNRLGFLLQFNMNPEVAEALERSVPNKAGGDSEVSLPVVLERVAEAGERFRLTLRLFPRDLIERRGRREARSGGGLKFMPPYALYPGAENHNTYSKLIIILNRSFREDEKPDEEKLKSEKLQVSVERRISEQRGKFVNEEVRAAFKDRVTSKKTRDQES